MSLIWTTQMWLKPEPLLKFSTPLHPNKSVIQSFIWWASHSVCLFKVSVNLLSSQPSVPATLAQLSQSLSASPCRKTSAWPTWQQATGNLSEHRRPDWLIHRHTDAHTYTKPQLFVLDRSGEEGRWRCFPVCDSDRGLERKGEVLSRGRRMNSFPPPRAHS